jgi:hypothetical protein
MKQLFTIFILAATLMYAAGKQTFTGIITDDMCEKADHKAMNMGPDPKCVTECVKGMGAKYVLYDGKNAYTLSDQKTPQKFAAKKVTVTGTLDEKTKTITVDSIQAAK